MRFFRKRVHFVKDGVNKNPTDGTLVAIVRRNINDNWLQH